jgi:hypothetical protein
VRRTADGELALDLWVETTIHTNAQTKVTVHRLKR